jgi:hypothetical protein
MMDLQDPKSASASAQTKRIKNPRRSVIKISAAIIQPVRRFRLLPLPLPLLPEAACGMPGR